MIGTTGRAVDLPQRLRQETADLHRRVEDAAGLPGSVRTRTDYTDLLRCLLALHRPLEAGLAGGAWEPGWDAVGIDLERHRRAHLLVDDLTALGASTSVTARRVPLPALRTFGEALGALYVLEGSSLGGRVLAPAIVSVVGEVPVGFLGADRGRPSPWQDLRAALRRVSPALADEVVLGARDTFAAFAAQLGARASATGPVP